MIFKESSQIERRFGDNKSVWINTFTIYEMDFSETSSSDYYDSFPSSSSNERNYRQTARSWAESSIDSYFRDEGYFSQTGINACDSRRTSVSFANLPIADELDDVNVGQPYLQFKNKFKNVIKDFVDNARNRRLRRYSSADSLVSLDPYGARTSGRYYGRECYSCDPDPYMDDRRPVSFCSSEPESSNQWTESSDDSCNGPASKEIRHPKIKSKRISINEPPVTAFFQHGSSNDQSRVRKVQSLREAPPKSILKKCSVKSEGHNSAGQEKRFHVYEVIVEEPIRYGERCPDPRPPVPERPIMWPMVIFPPEPLFQPRSRHAYHRRDAMAILD
uniref:Uncharacterized protein n=1 Tax=Steinernema glaseri TaxID=37863 RepID=A0A1I7ZTK8_9BILA